jgi:hypothetical protein
MRNTPKVHQKAISTPQVRPLRNWPMPRHTARAIARSSNNVGVSWWNPLLRCAIKCMRMANQPRSSTIVLKQICAGSQRLKAAQFKSLRALRKFTVAIRTMPPHLLISLHQFQKKPLRTKICQHQLANPTNCPMSWPRCVPQGYNRRRHPPRPALPDSRPSANARVLNAPCEVSRYIRPSLTQAARVRKKLASFLRNARW